jgi:uncharacterized damage-inducible protein DinB
MDFYIAMFDDRHRQVVPGRHHRAGSRRFQSKAEILSALKTQTEHAKSRLASWGDSGLLTEWSLQSGEKTLMAMPRIGMVRSIMLNHWYHHRGQLTVYLRLLDVPVASVYGPSADENPFASA